ncbi:MAG: sugar ABC transporter ATP-binding protein, partial [Opitutaceae bacterium]|nr:sugar ABC transporter ATP-binding protein [Opitutaceae bacterium]
RQPGWGGLLHWRAIRQRARAALARLDMDCDVDAELGSLSVAHQQMVAIARALDTSARLLVLDEPTASLDQREVDELFSVMRKLRAEGFGIVFVTHFLDQVYAVTDRLTVLRNGRLVGAFITAELPRLALVGKMLGRDISAEDLAAHATTAEYVAGRPPALLARHLGRQGAVEPLDLALHAGQVTGLGGLLGSGRTETARLLFGIDRCDTGEILLRGNPVRVRSPREAVRHGLAFCSEDRKAEGILPNLSVRENLMLALQGKRGAFRPLTRTEQEQLCLHYIQALKIKTADAETPIKNLSGGNQQKVLLARWLATQPEVILLDEPTRGIDIGAKQEIEALISQLRAEGMAVLFISSEIDEVVRTCSRVLVLRERRLAGEVSGAAVSAESLMRLMAGIHEAR